MLIRTTENCSSSQNVPIKIDLDACLGRLFYAPVTGFCFPTHTCNSLIEKKICIGMTNRLRKINHISNASLTKN